MLLYQFSQPGSIWSSLASSTGVPYYSISISLNVFLTIMIVARLVMHGRNVRKTTAFAGGVTGLYKNVASILIETSALYTLNSLLVIGPWAAGSWVADIFLPILAQTQVCAVCVYRYIITLGYVV